MSREFLIYVLQAVAIAFVIVAAWAAKKQYDRGSKIGGNRLLLAVVVFLSLAALWPKIDLRTSTAAFTAVSRRSSLSAAEIPVPVGGAVLHVEGKFAAPIPADQIFVPELAGGLAYRWISQPSLSEANGQCEFTVVSPGMVYLACDWTPQGSGDWKDGAATHDDLIGRGWIFVGSRENTPPDSRTLHIYRRICRAGESFSIRCNKYWPPLVLTPPGGGQFIGAIASQR